MPKKYDPKAWDPTCGRPGYYGKEAPPLQRARVLATPDSKVKSLPAYSFSTEKRPQPGLKQCWRLEMPDDPAAASHNSPGPIYLPSIECNSTRTLLNPGTFLQPTRTHTNKTQPKWSLKSRFKPLAGVMDNPAPNQYRKKFGLGIKEVDGRVPTRPQYGFGTATREQSRMVFIARKDTYRASSKYLIRG